MRMMENFIMAISFMKMAPYKSILIKSQDTL